MLTVHDGLDAMGYGDSRLLLSYLVKSVLNESLVAPIESRRSLVE